MPILKRIYEKNIWIITILLVIISCFLGRSMVANKTNDFQNDFSLDESMNVERESLSPKSILEGEGTVAVQGTESSLTKNEAAIFGKEMMEQYYGVYEIKGYYPGNDANKGPYRFCTLPDEEIDLLIGQRIVLTEDKYVAYDNFRFGGRSGDRDLSDYQIKKYVIDNPEYTIKVSYDQNEFGFEGYPEKVFPIF